MVDRDAVAFDRVFEILNEQHVVHDMASATRLDLPALQGGDQGRLTAHDHALDGDVILAAQTRHLGDDAVVATTDAAHLSRYVDARHWRGI